MTEQEWADFLARIEGHTLGPWVVCEDASGDTFVSGADYQYVADMAWRDEDLSCDGANAALTAAAPTLKNEVTRLRNQMLQIAHASRVSASTDGAEKRLEHVHTIAMEALKGGE